MPELRLFLKTYYTSSRALLIGIDNYVNASPLSYAVSDAIEVRNALVDLHGFASENVILLQDHEATRAGILTAFLRFAKEDVDVDERLLIFFAGHGHTRTGHRGEVGYLVPFDANPQDLATLIRWDELTRNAELLRPKHILFVMDACYGGLALSRSLKPGSSRFLKDMITRYSRQVLTAGKADEVVADSGGPIPNHSVFTGHLIEGLRGNASTAEGIITGNSLMAYVYAMVSRDKNSHQTPHYGHFDGDGDFVFSGPSLTEPEETDGAGIDRLVAVPYLDPPADSNSTSAKIGRIKSLLSSDTSSIELHDMLIAEVRRLHASTEDARFAFDTPFTDEAFLARLAQYEAVCTDLSLLLACLSHWARPSHSATLKKVLARSADRLEPRNGSSYWVALCWYPLIHRLYCSGISAIDAQRYDSLATIFYTPLPKSPYSNGQEYVLDGTGRGLLDLVRTDIFKRIQGHERQYVPISEYLYNTIQPLLDDVLFLGEGYDTVFDTFEVFYALAHADLEFMKGKSAWGPVGRFAWKHHSRENGPLMLVVSEGRSQKEDWAPLKAGLFGGSYQRFDNAATKYTEHINKLGWF